MFSPNYGAYPFRQPVKRQERKMPDPVSSSGFYKIVIVLDESGSMSNIRSDMIKSMNDIITEQQQVEDRPATFTFVKFNNKINRVIENQPLESIKNLTSEDYNPNGPTALYDAIGDTIDWFRNEKNVLMVIVTDGNENSSRSYNKQEVNRMIEQKKNNNDWTYVYLSCNLSTRDQGNNIGLETSSYTTNAVVNQENFCDYLSNNLNTAVKKSRMKGISVQSQLNS
jgi:Mg-chelatase subunit ChlD